jgi:hypothetical protein
MPAEIGFYARGTGRDQSDLEQRKHIGTVKKTKKVGADRAAEGPKMKTLLHLQKGGHIIF